MDYYLNRHTETDLALFDVFDTAGTCLYTVEGGWGPFGGRLYLRDAAGAKTAKINCVGIHSLCKYSVQIGKKERMCVTHNLVSSGDSLRLSKTDQSLCDDLLTRSFNAVDGRDNVHMAHVPCQTAHGNDYGIHVERQQDVPLSLCLAVIVSNAALYGPGCTVPAN